MPIYLGESTAQPVGLYIGDVAVKEVRRGATRVWRQALPARVPRPTLVQITDDSVLLEVADAPRSTRWQLRARNVFSLRSGWTITRDASATTRRAIIDRVPSGSDMYIQARAGNDRGWGEWSETYYTTVTSLPDHPRGGIVFESRTMTSITVTTQPTTFFDNTNGYEFEYRQGTTGAWIQLQRGESRTATATGLTEGASYQFRVRGFNRLGNGGYSSTLTVATAGTSALFTLSKVAGVGIGIVTMGATPAGRFYSFVRFRITGTTSWDSVNIGGDRTLPGTRYFGGDSGQAYDVQVAFTTLSNEQPASSAWSATSNVTMDAFTLFTLTQAARVVTVTSTLTLTQPGWQISWFEYRRRVSGTTSWTRVLGTGLRPGMTPPPLTFTGFSGFTYEVQVRWYIGYPGVNASGAYSGWSAIQSIAVP